MKKKKFDLDPSEIEYVYISGPMRGMPRLNFDTFYKCEEDIKETFSYIGRLHVINPARRDVEEEGIDPDLVDEDDLTEERLQQWMRRDLTDVARSQSIFILPGWEASTGARREMAVARWCGLKPWLYFPEREHHKFEWVTWDKLAERARAYDKANNRSSRGDSKQWSATPGFSNSSEEVRTTSPTGAQKGVKPERFDLIPVTPLEVLARVYGYGADKYDDHNWRKGYEWSKSFAALQRHLWAFWGGEDADPESGLPHLGHAAFHVFALLEWMHNPADEIFDDRWCP